MKTKFTKQEAINRIKQLLNFSEVKCMNAKLSDGTIVQWDGELTEGIALSVLDTDGNLMPVEDATHTLEDGTKITTVGGLVTGIEGPSVEKEVEVETKTEMASEFAAEFATHLETFNKMIERLSAVESKLTEYETKFSAIQDEVKNTETSTTEKFAKIVELVEKIAEEPQVIVEKPTNVGFKKVYPSTQSNLELFQQFAKETQK
jgi:hypothetical protein